MTPGMVADAVAHAVTLPAGLPVRELRGGPDRAGRPVADHVRRVRRADAAGPPAGVAGRARGGRVRSVGCPAVPAVHPLADDESAYYHLDGDLVVPTVRTQSSWDPTTQQGPPVCGCSGGRPPGCRRRSTCSWCGSPPTSGAPCRGGPLRIETAIRREGRRIQVVDVGPVRRRGRGGPRRRRCGCAGRRASGPTRSTIPTGHPTGRRRCRRGSVTDLPVGSPFRGPDVPEESRARASCARSTASAHDGATATGDPVVLWARMRQPLVAGQPTPPAALAAWASDFASGLASYLDPRHWMYMNPDVNLHLLREPVGDWIAIAGLTWAGDHGIGHGRARLYDVDGFIGSATAAPARAPLARGALTDEPRAARRGVLTRRLRRPGAAGHPGGQHQTRSRASRRGRSPDEPARGRRAGRAVGRGRRSSAVGRTTVTAHPGLRSVQAGDLPAGGPLHEPTERSEHRPGHGQDDEQVGGGRREVDRGHRADTAVDVAGRRRSGGERAGPGTADDAATRSAIGWSAAERTVRWRPGSAATTTETVGTRVSAPNSSAATAWSRPGRGSGTRGTRWASCPERCRRSRCRGRCRRPPRSRPTCPARAQPRGRRPGRSGPRPRPRE